jgi:hypothetical protein
MGLEIIRSIETKFEVESIRADGHQVWPLIRFYLIVNYQSQLKPLRPASLGARRILKLVAHSIYGFAFYFRRYNYLCFSDSSERKLINGKWVDKTIDFIVDSLPKPLLIELPLPRHYKRSEIHTHLIASKLPLYILEWFYATFFLRKINIENEFIIKNILHELNLEFDYLSVLRKGLAQHKTGNLLCRLYKPKGIFIQPSYTNTGLVKAFRDSKITVIEVQHGLISASHEAYNVFKKFDSSYFPDYFLSYGMRERDFFKAGNYVSGDQVIPTGHYYLDFINTSKKTVNEVIPEVLSFSYGVSITGQNLPDVEQKFIEFMKDVANRAPQVCFFYIPRNKQSAIFLTNHLPKNLIVTDDRDTYEVIRLTRFHSTIFSTCAIEALALGTPNILVNINNLAKIHLSEIAGDLPATVFVECVEEYVETLQTFDHSRKENVIKSSSYLIAADYKNNVKKFIEGKFPVQGVAKSPSK